MPVRIICIPGSGDNIAGDKIIALAKEQVPGNIEIALANNQLRISTTRQSCADFYRNTAMLDKTIKDMLRRSGNLDEILSGH